MVREKRISELNMLDMSRNEFETLRACLDAGAFHLLGIPWTKWIEARRDWATGDLVLRYE